MAVASSTVVTDDLEMSDPVHGLGYVAFLLKEPNVCAHYLDHFLETSVPHENPGAGDDRGDRDDKSYGWVAALGERTGHDLQHSALPVISNGLSMYRLFAFRLVEGYSNDH